MKKLLIIGFLSSLLMVTAVNSNLTFAIQAGMLLAGASTLLTCASYLLIKYF